MTEQQTFVLVFHLKKKKVYQDKPTLQYVPMGEGAWNNTIPKD